MMMMTVSKVELELSYALVIAQYCGSLAYRM